MRLFRFTKRDVVYKEPRMARSCDKTFKLILTKLQALENVEEDLGVPIPTIFKCLKHGAFYKDYLNNTIKHTCNLKLVYCKYSGLENKSHFLPFNEYGKRWALTKEELL